jgi:hypothetical protein
MKKVVLISLLLCVVLATPVSADIKGFVAVDYDTMDQSWLWELEVNKYITPYWLVGTNMTTYAPGYAFKHFIPSWVPYRLDYQVYTEFRYKTVSLRITDWCDHWFSQSGEDWEQDTYGLTVRLRYEF